MYDHIEDRRKEEEMAIRLGRTRAVVRHFDPHQMYWIDARIVVDNYGITLETFWRNPELAGVWLWTCPMTDKILGKLITQDLIVLDPESTPLQDVFRLSAKGKARLE